MACDYTNNMYTFTSSSLNINKGNTLIAYKVGGSPMPGRSFNSSDYRYGFNGKEKDDEIEGNGNVQNYGMRMYDTRLGRFFSVDPLTKDYPWNSTYAFAENDVIRATDLDGAEKNIVHIYLDKNGKYVRSDYHAYDKPLLNNEKYGTLLVTHQQGKKDTYFYIPHPKSEFLNKKIMTFQQKIDEAKGEKKRIEGIAENAGDEAREAGKDVSEDGGKESGAKGYMISQTMRVLYLGYKAEKKAEEIKKLEKTKDSLEVEKTKSEKEEKKQ